MYLSRTYICPSCGSSKAVMKHPSQTMKEFQTSALPTGVLCGVNGCEDYARPELRSV